MLANMRSKTVPEFVLASKKADGGGGHDPKAQRDRMTMFKRQMAANRTRSSDEMLKRNRALSQQKPSNESPNSFVTRSMRNRALSVQKPSNELQNSFVTRSMVEALREERLTDDGGRPGGGGATSAPPPPVITTTPVTAGRGKGGEEVADEIETHHINAEDWPFIYFVVALDQMPVAAEDANEFKIGKPHTAKERQRFLAARKRRIVESREEMERIRESNIDMGLRLEPIRPNTRSSNGGSGGGGGPVIHHHRGPTPQTSQGGRGGGGGGAGKFVGRQRAGGTPSRPAPTPVNSGQSRDFSLMRAEYFLQHPEEMTMDDTMCRGIGQWFSDNFTPSGTGSPAGGGGGTPANQKARGASSSTNQKPGSGSSTVELPNIAGGGGGVGGEGKSSAINNDGRPSDSAPGIITITNDNNRKVTFATSGEGLPYIKGSGIAVPMMNSSKQTPPDAGDADTPSPTTPNHPQPHPQQRPESKSRAERADMLQPPWSAPVRSRSLATMTVKSKMFQPMPIPKIDIVSEIYDELIIKTIQMFLEKEGYSTERFSKLRSTIMARLSATYPHLARHRAWKLVRKEGSAGGRSGGCDTPGGPMPPLEAEEKNRLRLRPLHQGFFSAYPSVEVSEDFAKENNSYMNHLPQGSRLPSDQLKPRWVPVLPSYRPSSYREEERYSSSMFMSIDGRHIPCTPRDDLRFKTSILPGATSDYRMGPLVLQDDVKVSQSWTHTIPDGIDL